MRRRGLTENHKGLKFIAHDGLPMSKALKTGAYLLRLPAIEYLGTESTHWREP